MYRRTVILTLLIFLLNTCNDQMENAYMKLIQDGKFILAEKEIKNLLDQKNLSEEERNELTFQLDKMNRIRKDFNKNEPEILEEISKVIPDASAGDLAKWESSLALEVKTIDGEKKYFTHAARNLFRIDKSARKKWEEIHGVPDPKAPRRLNLEQHLKSVIKKAIETGKPLTYPARFKIKYTINLYEGSVPEGERVRCWIPYPREIVGRQVDIELISTVPEKYQIADNKHLQRTIYFEQNVEKDQQTTFSVEYVFTNHGIYFDVCPEKVRPVDPSGPLGKYLKEEPPHIVFSDDLKTLSGEIVGNEENPFLVAKKIYQWIGENVPWASAREYSTISNISLYPAINRHGDCGIKALMFITMLRMNGIPAQWQSGWEFQPPEKDSMHDWGMVYFEPYGWMPMDVDYGLRKSDDEQYKWFYLTGMDAYRLIFNDDISRPFSPVKIHHRSETVDSQRGELEWKGGNLYFDSWSWNMDWELISDESVK